MTSLEETFENIEKNPICDSDTPFLPYHSQKLSKNESLPLSFFIGNVVF